MHALRELGAGCGASTRGGLSDPVLDTKSRETLDASANQSRQNPSLFFTSQCVDKYSKRETCLSKSISL